MGGDDEHIKDNADIEIAQEIVAVSDSEVAEPEGNKSELSFLKSYTPTKLW